ncbi:MAG TPA: hypothetical protein DEG71_03610 [Clostridiales bacterium]|nr:hypothetical protein [Clostridiales bacterium]
MLLDKNLTIDNTGIIFGCGASIESIKEYIPLIQKKWQCGYLNRFPEFYPTQNKGQDYWLWADYRFYSDNLCDRSHLMKEEYLEKSLQIKDKREFLKDYKIITTPEINNREINKEYIKVTNGEEIHLEGYIKPHYLFNAVVDDIQLEMNNKLMMYKTSLHAAINFAIIKKYKNVILIGVDLDKKWRHFYDNIIDPSILKNHKDGKRYDIMIDKLYQCKDYINIYKINKLNNLSFEYLNISILL